jgi:hypothetical protein
MDETNGFIKPKMTFANELRFSAYAWAKLIWMRDHGPSEVAGYGITGTEDPLLVTDFKLIKQKCTSVHFELDPNDGVEFMEQMADEGLMPWMHSNLLIHTHPMDSPQPSINDEENFAKAFSHPNWAIMLIVAESGNTYCRLKINVGPGITKELKVGVDWSQPFMGSDIQKWDEEYKAKVTVDKIICRGLVHTKLDSPIWSDEDLCVDNIDCYWSSDGDVLYCDEENATWYTYEPVKEQWYSELPMENSMIEIEAPNTPWAKLIVEWAIKYANERDFAYEEDKVYNDGTED